MIKSLITVFIVLHAYFVRLIRKFVKNNRGYCAYLYLLHVLLWKIKSMTLCDEFCCHTQHLISLRLFKRVTRELVGHARNKDAFM